MSDKTRQDSEKREITIIPDMNIWINCSNCGEMYKRAEEHQCNSYKPGELRRMLRGDK